ncbi:hypothetical protein D9758_009018 [Tetrapyrgos nigripes]|uniref:DUF6987 domain-containing protein n=1 Tax=Tetrapyrgos nigripes TaxID=182062 RepID=A0A8H5LKS8_9AGAR|nr:hypothetical protein D9758_009018 [Tetrapyrgos nigripes]
MPDFLNTRVNSSTFYLRQNQSNRSLEQPPQQQHQAQQPPSPPPQRQHQQPHSGSDSDSNSDEMTDYQRQRPQPPPPPRASGSQSNVLGDILPTGQISPSEAGDEDTGGVRRGLGNVTSGLGLGGGGGAGNKAPSQSSISAEEGGRTDEEKKEDAELANRLSALIEDANERVVPLCKMIRKHIENMEARKEEDRDERELVEAVRPLLIQAEKILNETLGSVKGADPENRLTNRAKRHRDAHTATPEEQRLAEALKVLTEEVGGTIEWARGKLDSFPKAKRELGPLLDALAQPLTQIIAGVGMLLAGVLNLLGKLLSGLGLDSLLKGLVAAAGLDKIYAGLGLGKLFG